ncbi:amino acid adenylation domain-containing protein [Paenibacillus donghaensis]|uniref:non-ribosomal peptide synthetase/type I polyketide synthase n=1 Tax=Paenibacillus donghaensis TaxID=414771 RepID=UPI001883DC99|nr:non-ribosomal peptide synthetase/type I polyketide synthase [Paenibacillus donghaensis]MBE9913470.1 amino acid adenylation domain-containing protein [Paenibacillus donghaensis]
MQIERSNIQDIWPLRPVQEGMLFHYLTGTEEGKYVERLMLGIEGNVANEWFVQAWEHVFQANEVLRSVFRWEKLRKPIQVILKNKKPRLEIHDCSEESLTPTSEQAIRALERSTELNLAEETIKIALYKFDNECKLFLTYHHILLDGWSLGVILEEWLSAYRALSENRKPVKRDKASMKTILLALQKQQDHQAKAQFWADHLSEYEIKQPVQPFYKPPHHEFKKVSQCLSPEALTALQGYCRNSGMSLATFLYGTWAMLMGRFTYTNDVVFGTTVSGRGMNLPGLDTACGMLINTVPLRVRSSGEESVEDYFTRVHRMLASRRPHEWTGLSAIRQAAGLQGPDELFDTLVVIENYPLDKKLMHQPEKASREKELHFSSYLMDEHTHYPLTLLVRTDAGLVLDFIYDDTKYEYFVVMQMAECLVKLLLDLASDPKRKLADIALVKPEQPLLNGVLSPYPSELELEALSIPQLFMEAASQYPDRTAMIFENKKITYGELDTLSNVVAAELKRRGAGPEQCVGIQSYRNPHTIAGMLGILKAGAAYVPIHPAYPPERVEYIIKDTAMSLLLAEPEFTAKYAESTGVEGIDLHQFAQVKRECRDHPSKGLYQTRGASLACIVYTSGSTGDPKGVMIEHKGIVRLVKNTNFVDFYPTDVVLPTCPFEFDVSNFEIWGALLSGAALCLLPQEQLMMPQMLKKALREHQVSLMWMTTPLFNQLAGVDASLFGSLRYLIVGGDTLSPHHINKVRTACPDLTMVNGYGPSENTVLSTFMHINKNYETRIPIGQPITRSTAYVVDLYNHLLPAGAIGELCVGLEGVARGYLNKPEMTMAKFIPDPIYQGYVMYKTGDLARWLPDGNIDFFGRTDYQVKVRGYRIELQEVEAAMSRLPDIEVCVVQVTQDKHGDKELTAYFVSKQKLQISKIREQLSQHLPSYAVPTRYIQVDAMPFTLSGKIDKRALPNLVHDPNESAKTTPLPAVFMEQTVLQIWKDALELEQIGLDDAFFDIGGNSLLTIRVSDRIHQATGIEMSVTDLFQYPTVRELSAYLSKRQAGQETVAPENENIREIPVQSRDIAIIGMAGRFPGADNIEMFWHHLQQGKEGITFFTEEELRRSGISEFLLQRSDYVKAKGMLEGIEYFDAGLFGYSGQEAELMDPQLRLLHECVWAALEDAGYDTERYQDAIGLFVGGTVNLGWVNHLFNVLEDDTERWRASHLNVHSMSMPISYRLNLKGPSLTVETACSSSLVAVHLACQSLIRRESSIALAGGVSVTVPKKSGYLYQDGMIKSPDGHCRAFDADAKGTVSGDGLGIVVLKTLEDALRDGDHIYAIIKGSAVNNDGTRKAGFTAPSVTGQKEVVAAALEAAAVSADSIGYVETHGTGTPLGDPIEIEALSDFFLAGKGRPTAIGSVKTNIGHLDAAAGIAGLMKTVLSLHHKQIPPSLHYKEPNPGIPFDQTSLFVNRELLDWIPEQAYPRRAGVSSFGIGGTNAHVILEEAPISKKRDTQIGDTGTNYSREIYVFSAQTEKALKRKCKEMLDYLELMPDSNLHDIAYTLALGRKQLNIRIALVASTRQELCEKLQAFLSGSISSVSIQPERHVVFLFPGQGSQYSGMARHLYETEPLFRQEMNRCLEIARAVMSFDPLEVWLRDLNSGQESSASVRQSGGLNAIDLTEAAQPLLFMVEYALARLLQQWGIQPAGMIGHSLGEYTAACISGVLSLEEAIKLVVRRSSLMQQMQPGEMLSVNLAHEVLADLMRNWPELSIAASNSPDLSVISGPADSISGITGELRQMGIEPIRLQVSHAFHSAMMEPMLDDFGKSVREMTLSAPKIPYISNLTGEWITPGQAADPDYYSSHIRGTVRFREGLETLSARLKPIFLEVGPGRTLSQLVRHQGGIHGSFPVIDLIPRSQEKALGDLKWLEGLASLWMHGAELDWAAFYRQRPGKRISLPAYPFERQYYWKYQLETDHVHVTRISEAGEKERKVADWIHVPRWIELEPAAQEDSKLFFIEKQTVLLLCDPSSLADRLSDQLDRQGHHVIRVYPHQDFKRVSNKMYMLDPGNAPDYKHLYEYLADSGEPMPSRIIHLWGMGGGEEQTGLSEEGCQETLNRCLYSLIYLVQEAGKVLAANPIHLVLGTRGMELVHPEDKVDPLKSLLSGAASVIPLEYPNLHVHSLDVDSESLDEVSGQLLSLLVESAGAEAPAKPAFNRYAFRKRQRYIHRFLRKDDGQSYPSIPVLQQGGSYLITGGLSGIGLVLAHYLAEKYHAKLTLIGRSPREMGEETARIRGNGGQVHIEVANVTDRKAMERIIHEAAARYGALDGVFHAAGVADIGGMLHQVTREHTESVLAPKVEGTFAIFEAMNGLSMLPAFMVVFSSISSSFGAFGQASYAAANAFLDGFACACRNERIRVVSIDWDTWKETGMALDAVNRHKGTRHMEKSLVTESLQMPHPLLFGRSHTVWDAPLQEMERREEVQPMTTYISHLSADRHWVLNEHRLLGTSVLPGTAVLELVRASFMDLTASSQMEIQELLFMKPIIVEQEAEIRIVWLPSGEGTWRFSVLLRGEDGLWNEHAKGFASATLSLTADYNGAESLQLMLDKLRAKGNIPEARIMKGAPQGLEYGPHWNALRRMYLEGEKGIAELRLDEECASDVMDFNVHPALMDRATSFIDTSNDLGASYLPFAYKNVRMYRSLTPTTYSCGQVCRNNEDINSFSFQLCDEKGQLLLDIGEYIMSRVHNKAMNAKIPLGPNLRLPMLGNSRLLLSEPGNLDQLHFSTEYRHKPQPGEVEIKVAANGLNFKEVLYALGMLSLPSSHSFGFGLECAGTITRVGERVIGLKPGDRVMAIAGGSLGKYVSVSSVSAVRIPSNLSFAEAATIPISFMTAYYSLVVRGQLSSGERVLIHSATGGVGLAAVQIAQWIGAEIYATAGTQEKRDYLRSIGIRHVYSSRDLKFAEEIQATCGHVDVVLNSLIGEAAEKSLSLLAPHGRFLELGIRDIAENKTLGMQAFADGISFSAISIDTQLPNFHQMFGKIVHLLEEKAITPLPLATYGLGDTEQAFRFMASARHIGKIVICQDNPAAEPENLESGYASGIRNAEGMEALEHILRAALSEEAGVPLHYLLSVTDLKARENQLQPNLLDWVSGKESPSGAVRTKKRPFMSTEYAAPVTETEKQLADIFMDFLGLEQMGLHDNFFEAGATSLDLIQINAKVNLHAAKDQSVVKLYSYPTIYELNQYLFAEGSVESKDTLAQQLEDGQQEDLKRKASRLKTLESIKGLR